MGVPAINVRFSMYVDRPGVMNRVGAWRHGILSRAGAYGRGVIRHKFRPALKGKQTDRNVVINGVVYFVQAHGPVLDKATGRPARRSEADLAREEWLKRHIAGKRGKGEGKPPRVGPTGKLKQFTDFGIDAAADDTVVMGSVPFARQPELVKAATVPDLLNAGGGERVAGVMVRYGPRPFVEVSLPPVVRFTKQLIRSNPVR